MDCTQQKLRLFHFFFNVEADHLSARSFFFNLIFGHTSDTWDPSSLSRYSTPGWNPNHFSGNVGPQLLNCQGIPSRVLRKLRSPSMIHSFTSLWPELPVPVPVSSEAHALSLARSSVLSASPFNIPFSCTCQQKLSVPRGHNFPCNLLSGWLFSPALAPARGRLDVLVPLFPGHRSFSPSEESQPL